MGCLALDSHKRAKVLEELARHRGEEFFDECNPESGRIQPVG